MKKLYFLFAVALFYFNANSQVVISQAYGGGGNSGSVYTNDFVELFNRGTVAVNITGYSIQYASSTGASWQLVEIPTFTLQPGKYYLVQMAQGSGGTTPLPTPDYVPTTPIAMSGTNFKVLLTNNNTPVSAVSNPSDSNIIDFLGVGSANYYEGTAAAPVLSNTTSAQRLLNGCQDTNNNSADFIADTVTPRNNATAANVCGTASTKNFDAIAGLTMYPNPVSGNILNITSAANLEMNVAIFDVLGKQVINTKVNNNTVNVSSLNAGVYIVKITEDGKTATRKLVVK